MHDKSIENCHVENVVFGKDFNLGMTGSFFPLSPKCDRVSNVLEFFHDLFENNTMTRKIFLKNKLNGLCFEENGLMNDYLNQIQRVLN